MTKKIEVPKKKPGPRKQTVLPAEAPHKDDLVPMLAMTEALKEMRLCGSGCAWIFVRYRGKLLRIRIAIVGEIVSADAAVSVMQ
mgnify:CR=1 FL=1